MQLRDEGKVLLSPLCTVHAIGSRFVVLRENRLAVDVYSFQDSPSELFTGLSISVTGYVTSTVACQLTKDGTGVQNFFFREPVQYCRNDRMHTLGSLHLEEPSL